MYKFGDYSSHRKVNRALGWIAVLALEDVANDFFLWATLTFRTSKANAIKIFSSQASDMNNKHNP
jgi:hypothetical protein